MSQSAPAPSQRPYQPRKSTFPQNVERYPDQSNPLPADLSNEEICSRFPNHIKGKIVEMACRGFFGPDIYKHVPEDTKRDRDKDLSVIRTWLYKANTKRGSGLRRTRAQMAADKQWRMPNYQHQPTAFPSTLPSSSQSSVWPLSQGQPVPLPSYDPLPQLSAEPSTVQSYPPPQEPDQQLPPHHVQQQLPQLLQTGKHGHLGPFPQNADLYPAKNTPIPVGTSDEEICARYPNHLSGDVLRGLKARGFDHNRVYAYMPANAKRTDRATDLKLLQNRFKFRSSSSSASVPDTSDVLPHTTSDCSTDGLQHGSYPSGLADETMGEAQHDGYATDTPEYAADGLELTPYPDDATWYAAQAAAAGYYPSLLD
jgi:hypothetical protein